MIKIGQFEFPEQCNIQECQEWKSYTTYVALASNVLAVANTRIEGGWSAYCGAVPGVRHSFEWQAVLREGDKLPEHIARAIFPQFVGVRYSP